MLFAGKEAPFIVSASLPCNEWGPSSFVFPSNAENGAEIRVEVVLEITREDAVNVEGRETAKEETRWGGVTCGSCRG